MAVSASRQSPVRIFLCGDVMIGRGIDQILPHPCPPQLHEDYARSALDYVDLAERRGARIPRPASPDHVWGCALDEFETRQPQARLINLETSVTLSERAELKGINYRVSPRNAGCLQAARIDCCVLANNHVMDYGRAGLMDTLRNLSSRGVACVGAGANEASASKPALLDLAGGGGLIISALALTSSGTPLSWGAKGRAAGVAVLDDDSPEIIGFFARALVSRKPSDIAIASIHWGGNWGYGVDPRHAAIARRCIDEIDVSIVHGHSSHHPRPLEFYRNRLILYGCGDLLNDYEGISGHEEFRSELVLMYFADVDRGSGDVLRLSVVPLRLRGFRLTRPSQDELIWMQETLARICAPYGARISADATGACVAEPEE